MFLTPFRLTAAASRRVRVTPYWSTSDESTLTATGGVSDGNNLESWDSLFGSGVLDQTTTGDRPQIETGDVDGLVMSKHSDTEHLTYPPLGQIRMFVATVYDYGSGNPRRVMAIDTSAVTDKPAVEFLIEDVTS